MTIGGKTGLVLGLALGFYVVSYALLSARGAYAAAVWGLKERGPKWYRWAPWGFYEPETGKWRMRVVTFYAPLEAADNRFWHTHGTSLSDDDRQHPAVWPDYGKE